MKALALFAFALTLFGAAAAEPAAPAATILIKNFDFSPMSVEIPVGGEVAWKNLDGEVHTVVSLDGSFRSVALDQGDSFSFRFTKPGTYAYLCSVHPQMKAVIIVK